MDQYIQKAQSFFDFKFILMWIGLGLIIGVAAKLLLPGSENMGWIRTVLVGILGSFIGNYVGYHYAGLGNHAAFSWQGIMLGIAGAFVLVLLNRLVTKS